MSGWAENFQREREIILRLRGWKTDVVTLDSFVNATTVKMSRLLEVQCISVSMQEIMK